jgi:hypothetical protein
MKRRELLSWLSVSPALLAGPAAHAQQSKAHAPNTVSSSQTTGQGQITALNPKGTPPPIQLFPMAPRLDSLNGKTVYLVDTGFHGSDVLLHQIEAWFNQNMPGVTVVFRRKAGPYMEDDPNLWKEIKTKGNAAIMAVGH